MQWDCDILHMIWAYCIENSESDPCKGERWGLIPYLQVGANLSERFFRSEAPPIEATTRKGSTIDGVPRRAYRFSRPGSKTWEGGGTRRLRD
jgi:hypothetical protein